MNILIHHIEFLFTKHDCVCMPGLGGFILSYQKADISEDGVMKPPYKAIQFNESLNHNDGLLVSSIMNEKNISFSEAEYILTSEILSIKNRLNEGLAEEFGSIGSLIKNQEGNIEFIRNSRIENFDLSLTGFKAIHFDKITPVKRLSLQDDNNEFEIKHNNVIVRNYRRVSFLMIFILTFLLFSLPTNKTGLPSNQASLISTQMLSDMLLSDFNYYKDKEATLFSETVNNENNDLLEESELIQSNSTEIQSENVTDVETINGPRKRYYLIIGSFPDNESAQKYILKLNKRGLSSIKILEKSDRFRLYIDVFDNKPDAESFLNNFRDTTSFKDAWLIAHIS